MKRLLVERFKNNYRVTVMVDENSNSIVYGINDVSTKAVYEFAVDCIDAGFEMKFVGTSMRDLYSLVEMATVDRIFDDFRKVCSIDADTLGHMLCETGCAYG